MKFEKGQLTGDMAADISATRTRLRTEGMTDEAIGKMEEGHSWHHVEGGQEMELVPTDLHDAYKHTGGRADIKGGNWFARGVAAVTGALFGETIEAHANGTSVVVGAGKDALNLTDAALIKVPGEVGTVAGKVMDQRVDNVNSGDPNKVDHRIPILDGLNSRAKMLHDLEGGGE